MQLPDAAGRFGPYGGRYVPETLTRALDQLTAEYQKAQQDASFQAELDELLKNYVHGYQLTGDPFYAATARDIIRWMDEWLSNRERGGFYASQDADIDLNDDGDYFTWSLAETREVLTGQELEAAALHYDIGEVGEMHHRPEKNVLHIRATPDQIATRMKLSTEEVQTLLASAKAKMLRARLNRQTPVSDWPSHRVRRRARSALVRVRARVASRPRPPAKGRRGCWYSPTGSRC